MKLSNTLRNTCFELWQTKCERKDISQQFKPDFKRFIGVENVNEYDSILKTLISKVQEDEEHSICFDGKIGMVADFDLINTVKAELEKPYPDIIMFANAELNNIFLEALDYVTKLAISHENFFNDNVKNNFICKMILYTYTYISKMQFEDNITNKCIYYGDISRQDIYFLIMLYRMTFDVIYVNPLREEYWAEIDSDCLSECIKSPNILPIITMESRAKNGSIIEVSNSITVQLEAQIEAELYNNTGVYKPWQFRNGDTKAVFFNSTLIDLENNIYEPSRVRQGFKTENKTVYIPHFFFEIEGEYNDYAKYCGLVNKSFEAPNTLVVTQLSELFEQTEIGNRKYELSFCQNNDKTFAIDKVKESSFYSYSNYNDSTENFILNKINEIILNNPLMDNREVIDFCAMILNLNKNIIRLIDNFDFTDSVPKLIIFLEGENSLDKNTCCVLQYLNNIGFDLIIFAPAGMSNLSSYIDKSCFNTVRLDKMNYTRRLEEVKNTKQKANSFFSKLFNSI